VIDPEDEYRALCTAVDGQVIRLASSSRQHLNPFDLPPMDTPDPDDVPDPLAEHVTTLLGLLDLMVARPGPPLSTAERALLDRALYATYAAAGITADPATHTRPVPLLRDLHHVLSSDPAEIARDLATRLERYVHGSLAGLFSAPTDVALGSGQETPRFIVFNVQSLETELRPIGIQLITSFVWNQVRRRRRPRLLIIDEAWSLVQDPEGGAFLGRMARRARKYFLGLVTITQDVADFLDSEHGRTVLGNAALKLLLKQDSTTIDPVVSAFQLSAEERQLLLGAGKGEGILFARGSHLALRIEASPAEHRLATTAPRELATRSAAERIVGPATPIDAESRTGAHGKDTRNVPRRHLGQLSPEDER